MKSVQFNYFAAGEDTAVIARTVLDWEPNIVCFPPRGSERDLIGARLRDYASLSLLSLSEMHLLCSVDDAAKVQATFVDARISCIVVQDNPVIEYSPSGLASDGIVKIGRFYASYGDIEFMAKVRVLLRSLKKHAAKLRGSDVWIFPVAARTSRKLRPWGGADWDNPFFLDSK